MPNEDQQRKILMKSVDEGLLTLGENGMKAIYYHIENVTSVKREDIPDNLEALQKGLEKIFGEGARIIQTVILKSLCQKLGSQHEEDKDKSFVENINDTLKGATVKG